MLPCKLILGLCGCELIALCSRGVFANSRTRELYNQRANVNIAVCCLVGAPVEGQLDIGRRVTFEFLRRQLQARLFLVRTHLEVTLLQVPA